jgi:hypothetical protein
MRAFDDKTSTCETCAYWDGDSPGRPKGEGYCGWSSVPAWVHKHLTSRDDHRIMSATEGLDCWQHTKRGKTQTINAEPLLRRLSVIKGGGCPVCGEHHEVMPCPNPPVSAGDANAKST